MAQYTIRHGDTSLCVPVADDNVIWFLEPKELEALNDVEREIEKSLQKPIGTRPLSELLVSKQKKVVILVDDISRPTPQHRILPIILDTLNRAGVPDDQISIIIALGTHRPMTEDEMLEKYGAEIWRRVEVKNNPWDNREEYTCIGKTNSGIPVYVLKDVVEAGFLIGVGNIEPHVHAGWSGGAKIVQPGVCNWETTGFTHLLAPRDPRMFELPGQIETPFRLEAEEIASMANLKFIVNTVIGKEGAVLGVFAGDPILAHRAGVEKAREALVRPISRKADIVVVTAYPGEIDYWQGAKAVFLAQKGLEPQGVTILVGTFPEGICNVHDAFEQYARASVGEIERLMLTGKLADRVCGGALLQHARLLQRTKVICYSEGLREQQIESLGFEVATSLEDALGKAFALKGKHASVGVIDYGWMIIPELVVSPS